METNRLRQFCTVVETGNLRKAAELLGISHSGLSKSMKAFEQEVGFPLFQPSGRGIVISDQGRSLYERSGDFFMQMDHLLNKGDPEHKIRLGSFEVFTTYFMGKLLKNYLSNVEVEVHELVPGRLEEALVLNKIDLGITYEPIPRTGIEYVKVNSIAMGIFALNSAFREKPISEVPFVAPVQPLEGAPSGVKGLDGWPEDRIKRTVAYRVDLMVTGLELVRQGLCAIFVPGFVAKFYNESTSHDFKIHPLPLPKQMKEVKRDVYIVKRESTVEDHTIKQVAKALRNL